MNKNFKDMLLESESGYMMPFSLKDDEELQVTLGYGKQKNPKTGEDFMHQGIDCLVKDKPLYAVATGYIIGMGQNATLENYIVAKYGKYEVTYGHISDAFKNYGMKVKAGDEIAKSGDFLHLGVRFDGEDLDPNEFLSMLWANIQQLAAMGIKAMPTTEKLGDKSVKTKYDDDKEEILMMMLQWFPNYWNDIRTEAYTPPSRLATILRNIFTQAASKNYFFEKIPDVGNPLGLSGRSAPLAEKMQNLLIEDFLGYMVSKHSIYPSNWDEQQKKKLSNQVAEDGLIADPLADMAINVGSYDVEREASVYPDRVGLRWWTKAWFNGRDKGEKAIEITRQQAIQFINDNISMDDWLSRFYPKQMTAYHKAIEQARQQILGF